MTDNSTLKPRTDDTRREFLRTALIGAGAVGTGLLAGNGLTPVTAANPIKRNGSAHMKLSLAAYSFHRHLPFHRWGKPQAKVSPSSMTLDDFIHFCADLQLDGTELTGYYFPRQITNDYLMHLKELTFRLGLDISGTAIGNNFCLPAGPERKRHLALTKKWIDYAAVMGAPVIRIFAGYPPKGDTEEAARRRCIEAINESLDYAAKKGVFLALENHGGIVSDADGLLKVVEGVKPSGWFGVNLDSGNFQYAAAYDDLARIAPYAVNVQIKVNMHFGKGKNRKEVPADFKRIIGILRSAKYRGYVVLEYEGKPEPRTAIPGHIRKLRDLIHG